MFDLKQGDLFHHLAFALVGCGSNYIVRSSQKTKSKKKNNNKTKEIEPRNTKKQGKNADTDLASTKYNRQHILFDFDHPSWSPPAPSLV